MTKRPTIAASVTALFTSEAPKRLVRKLDTDPQLADAWDWQSSGEEIVVTTDKGESVALRPRDGVVGAHGDVRCTCLLAPRCLHVLAVVTLLDLAVEDARDVEDLDESVCSDDARGSEALVGLRDVNPAQREAALALRQAASAVLIRGAHSSGAMLQAELLRAVHGARIHGLPRAAAAGLSLVRYLRDLRAGRSSFVLSEMSDCMLELLSVTEALAKQQVAQSAIGSARRTYHEAGSLRLYGLFCEPVVSHSGYAGVSTVLCDDEARLYTVSDVMPAEAERALGAYDASADIGGSSIAHRELVRSGLYIQGATASLDGRLGRGAKVKASRAPASSWFDDAPEKLWSLSLEAQLDKMQLALQQPMLERKAGWDLVFIDGHVLGATATGVAFRASALHQGTTLELVVPMESERLRFRDNLAVLGNASGLPLRVVGRVRLGEARHIAALAVAPAAQEIAPAAGETSEPSLALPEPWGSRVCLGMDLLTRSFFANMPSNHGPQFTSENLLAVDPLAGLRRVIERSVLGGMATLPPEARPTIRRHAAQLQASMMPAAAALLLALLDAALIRGRDQEGKRAGVEALRFAEHWSRAARYEAAAAVSLQRALWSSI